MVYQISVCLHKHECRQTFWINFKVDTTDTLEDTQDMVLAGRRLRAILESYTQDGCQVCSQTQLFDNCEGMSSVVQPWSEQVLRFCITVDETRINHKTPKTKQQSNQWVPPSEMRRWKPRWVCLPAKPWRQFLGSTRNNQIIHKGRPTKVNIMPTSWIG